MVQEKKSGILATIDTKTKLLALISLVAEALFIGSLSTLPAEHTIYALITCAIVLTISIIGIIAIELTEVRIKRHGVDKFSNCMENNANVFLVYQRDLPRIEVLISEAKDEIWISGIDLNIIINHMDTFVKKVREGVKIKFLAINPEEGLIKETSAFRGMEPSDLAARLRINFNILHQKLVQLYPNQVEFKVFNYRPAIGYFIIDPHNDENAQMNALTYMYQAFSMNEPSVQLTRKNDIQWFKVYLREFEKIWESSSTFLPANLSHN